MSYVLSVNNRSCVMGTGIVATTAEVADKINVEVVFATPTVRELLGADATIAQGVAPT